MKAAFSTLMPEAVQRSLYRIFKFFASLPLAIFNIVVLMTILATGTILESLHGASTAQILIYEAPWFSAFLLLLGTNVAAAALDRLPWQGRHTGFVITHAGIIIILLGSLMTQKLMIDGQMPINEGETEAYITLQEPLLYVYSEDLQKDWFFPIRKRAFPWSGREVLTEPGEATFSATLTDYFPKGRIDESLVEADAGPAAIEINLENSFVNQTQWLVEDDPGRSRLSLGPAQLVFADELLPENLEAAPATGYLEFQFKTQSIQTPVDAEAAVPAVLQIEGTPYQVEIRQIFRNAIVVENELKEQENPVGKAASPHGVNPAVQFLLRGPELAEEHTAFANFPDFSTIHGKSESDAGAKIFYRTPNTGSRGESHELRFVEDAERGLLYQVKDGFEVRTGEVTVGEEVSTGWMDLKFRVKSYYPHSKVNRSFTPVSNRSESDLAMLAIRVEITEEGKKKSVWLGQGYSEAMDTGRSHYHLVYGQKKIPLGFKIELKDFRVQFDPGTQQAASYESDVVLKDDSRGIVRDVNISMNEPLAHRGFRIYQSGYLQPEGGPEMSIFSVGRDPSIPVKYAGTIVMVTGVIIMFYFKSYFIKVKK